MATDTNMIRPNVLIICVDEMRADHMACAGNPIVRTPSLDRLAARGTLFTRSYVANPICMPARASMFTGMLPRDHGVRVNGQNLRRDVPTLPGVLADAGYRTHSAGKLHLTAYVPKVGRDEAERFPECLEFWDNGVITEFPTPYYGFQTVDFVGGHVSFAFGEYTAWLRERGGSRELLKPHVPTSDPGDTSVYSVEMPEELHYNRFIADSTIEAIAASRHAREPFFIWCSFPDPHAPIGPPKPYCDMYDPASMPLPDSSPEELSLLPGIYRDVFSGALQPNGQNNAGVTDKQRRDIIAGTYGMVTHLDTEIGRVLDALEEHGVAEETVVVFLADHGDMMGDHGLLWKSFYTFEGCIRIPTIVSVPGRFGGPGTPVGVQCESLISQIDLLPSILDLCDVPMPGADWTETETPFQRGTERPLSSYPGRSWASLACGSREPIRDAVVLENDDPVTGYRVRALVTERYRLSIYPGTGEGELFDLKEDPNELVNLFESRADLRHELTARLLSEYAAATPWFPIPPWNS